MYLIVYYSFKKERLQYIYSKEKSLSFKKYIERERERERERDRESEREREKRHILQLIKQKNSFNPTLDI